MKLRHVLILFTPLLTIGSEVSRSYAQGGQIAATVTTGAMLSELRQQLTSALNSARVTGDYLMARALMQSLAALDAWERANTNILNTAFNRVNQQRVATLNDLRGLLASGSFTANQLADRADQVVLTASNTLADVHFSPPVYITKYSPAVMPPDNAKTFNLRLQGIGLSRGNLKVNVPGAQLRVVGPQEVVVTLPKSAFKTDAASMTLNDITITHLDATGLAGTFTPRTVTRRLPIMTLPAFVGVINVEVRVKTERREDNMTRIELGQFKGRNETQVRIVVPPQGWLWNVDARGNFKFEETSGGSDHGRCENIDWSQSNQNGITVNVRLDQTNHFPPREAFTNCALIGAMYRTTPDTLVQQLPQVQLSWTDGESIPLPPQEKRLGFTVTFKTFNGLSSKFDGTYSTQFAQFTEGSDQLIVNPIVPQIF